MSAKAPNGGMFLPQLWSDAVLEEFKRTSIFSRRELEPNDVWQGGDGNGPETYEEAVAWARLLNVTVLKPTEHGATGKFIVYCPGRPRRMMAYCSPADLILEIKHAANLPPEP